MDFSSGNSGNALCETVLKVGNECQQEGAYCEFLGPDICPKIYAIVPNGYVMEKLKPAFNNGLILISIENLLRSKVWSRPALPVSTDKDWREELEKLGIRIPFWLKTTKECLVHGDPTISNCLMRTVSYQKNELVLCDPRPPRAYIPQWIETDMACIIQSLLGWEEAAYGRSGIQYIEPSFMNDKDLMRQVYFWVGAKAARIQYQEERGNRQNQNILNWCHLVRGVCNV